MRNLFEWIWLFLTVAPVIVLSFRTGAARRKVKRSAHAWKMVERYIA